MRYIIVGPAWPFKGGIVHYNCWLGNVLKRKGNEVIGISFRKLYPKLFFHGKKQRDNLQKNKFEFNNNELLNSMNPITWLKTLKKIKSLNPDVLILYWWTPFFAFLIRHLSSFNKCKTICICHNVLPHERTKLDKALTKYALKKIDYFIVHGVKEKAKLQDLFPNLDSDRINVTPHPSYGLQFKTDSIDKETAKMKLDLKGKILLFFGFIREYKGLEYLIKAMPKINSIYNNITLLIVGEFWDNKAKYQNLISELKLNNIRIIDNYVPDKDVGLYFISSDLLVVPYTSATSSGVVQIAFSFNLPVIVTNVGVLEEIVDHQKTGFIIPTKNPDKIAETVINYYNLEDKEYLKENIKKEAYRFSWDRLVDTIDKIVKSNTN